MSTKTVYLSTSFNQSQHSIARTDNLLPVSGANRGIGYGLTETLAKRPNTVVFAGARDPVNAKSLNNLAAQYPNAIHVIKLTSASVEDNKAAVAEIKKTTGQLDVVIANAGEQK